MGSESPKFVTVCDRGGVTFVKSSVCIRYEQHLISKDYNKAKQIGLQYIRPTVQQIVVVTFELTGAARGFMIMSFAARGGKKGGKHWHTRSYDLSLLYTFSLLHSFSLLYTFIQLWSLKTSSLEFLSDYILQKLNALRMAEL